jgi:hypothetical protein
MKVKPRNELQHPTRALKSQEEHQANMEGKNHMVANNKDTVGS